MDESVGVGRRDRFPRRRRKVRLFLIAWPFLPFLLTLVGLAPLQSRLVRGSLARVSENE